MRILPRSIHDTAVGRTWRIIASILLTIGTAITLISVLPWSISEVGRFVLAGLEYIIADPARPFYAVLTLIFAYILYIQLRYRKTPYIVDEAETTFWIDDVNGVEARRETVQTLRALQPGVTAHRRKVIPEEGTIPERSIRCSVSHNGSRVYTRSLQGGRGWEIIHDFTEPMPIGLFGFNTIERRETLRARNAFPDCEPPGGVIQISTSRYPHRNLVLKVYFPRDKGLPDTCSAHRISQNAMTDVKVETVQGDGGPGLRAEIEHSKNEELRLTWSFD